MLNNLTYKKKNILLVVSGLLFLILSYQLAFKKTILAYSESKELENKMESASNAPQQIARISAELNKMSGFMEYNSDSGNIQQSLLGVITNYCQVNHVILREVPKSLSVDEKGFHIDTYIFTIEGGFIKLLKLVNSLEKKNTIGRLVSADFKTKEDLKTKSFALTATVYVQAIKKISHEN